MLRALQLARGGEGFATPNPMVGAVIVASDGRIIGEGFHRRWGEPHAEVNAIASVRPEDRHLLRESTIYVTLEPCSHYGKTPPCARLIIETGIPRVVVGAPDPFVKVAGRGIRMLREAGVEVIEDVMREECEALNRRFMTAHRLGRPFIQLKWAESADGFMASGTPEAPRPVRLSGPLSSVLMHRERASADAILVGTNTVVNDDPALTVRLWPGHDPLKVTFDSASLPREARMLREHALLLDPDLPIEEQMHTLYADHGVTSLMVEGGRETLHRFISAGLWDEIRREISPRLLDTGLPAPTLPPHIVPASLTECDGSSIEVYAPASDKKTSRECAEVARTDEKGTENS